MSPDMVSEVKVLTSNYAPEYGASTLGQIMAVTESGGSDFHGAGVRYHRNDCAQRDAVGRRREAASCRKQQLRREHRRTRQGAGPLVRQGQELLLLQLRRLPPGGRVEPADAVDSLNRRAQRRLHGLARHGSGNLIPIYDPATIRPDGAGGSSRTSSWGATAITPNVICPSRINPLVRPWLRALPNADERRTAQQLPRAADSRHDSR